MSRLFAGLAAIALLCAVPHPASAAPAAPGSVDPAPSPPPASPPAAAAPSATPTAATPPANEATPPAKSAAKKPVKRRAARHRHYGYPYWRRDPFFYAHPRFWWPFYPRRYRAYRYPRRHYYHSPPFFMFRW